MKKLKLEELERASLSEYKKQKKLDVVVVLDDIRSGMNVVACGIKTTRILYYWS